MLTSLFGSKKDSKKGPSLASGGPSLAAGGTSPLDYNMRSGSENGSAPRQYRERVVGAEDTQQVASSAQGNTRSSSPQPAASPQQGGSDERDRDRQFDVLKKHLETALRAGDTDKIIEGYRNLGQHFMQGKTLAEQQAAKQMFEKALEHAGSPFHTKHTHAHFFCACSVSETPPSNLLPCPIAMKGCVAFILVMPSDYQNDVAQTAQQRAPSTSKCCPSAPLRLHPLTAGSCAPAFV